MFAAQLRRLQSRDWIPIFFAQGFGLACGVAGVYLTSRWVPPEVFGQYGLVLTLVPAGGLITHHGLARHAARHWPVGRAREARAYAQAVWRGGVRPSLVLLALLAVGWWLTPELGTFSLAKTLPWLWLAALAGAWGAVVHTILQAERAYQRDAIFSCFNSLARTGGPLLALALTGASAMSLLAGFASAHLVGLGAATWLGLRYLRSHDKAPTNGQATPLAAGWLFGPYERAFWIAGIATLLNAGLPRWLAATCLGAHELGAFVLAGNLAIVLPNVLSGALGQFLLPRLRARVGDVDASPREVLRQVEQAALAFAIVAVGAVALLHLAMPLLAGRIFDLRYADATRYVFANGAYGVALALVHLYQFPALIADRPERAASVPVTFAAVGLLGGLAAARVSAELLLGWLTATPLIATVLSTLLARRIHLQDAPQARHA